MAAAALAVAEEPLGDLLCPSLEHPAAQGWVLPRKLINKCLSLHLVSGEFAAEGVKQLRNLAEALLFYTQLLA